MASEKNNVSILTTDPLWNKVADQVYIEGWMKVKRKFHIYFWTTMEFWSVEWAKNKTTQFLHTAWPRAPLQQYMQWLVSALFKLKK